MAQESLNPFEIALRNFDAAAERLGLDAQKLFDIASKSSGQCWSMTSYCPVPGPVPGLLTSGPLS